MSLEGDVHVVLGSDHVAEVEIRRPPNNFFDIGLMRALADAYERLDADARCRCILLCSEGKHFCAGADHGGAVARSGANATSDPSQPDRHLFDEAIRLFRRRKPVVAAVQGAAVGGGMALALTADFRVAAPQARLAANFSLLGTHHGFGLTVTLPRLVGEQRALELLLLGTRVKGDEAVAMGLCDRLAPLERLRAEARAFAAEIASSAPLAVTAIRRTMRADIDSRIEEALRVERVQQDALSTTDDRREGIEAVAQRRPGRFTGT